MVISTRLAISAYNSNDVLAVQLMAGQMAGQMVETVSVDLPPAK